MTKRFVTETGEAEDGEEYRRKAAEVKRGDGRRDCSVGCKLRSFL